MQNRKSNICRRALIKGGIVLSALPAAHRALSETCQTGHCVLLNDQDLESVFGNRPPTSGGLRTIKDYYRLADGPQDLALRTEMGELLSFFSKIFEVRPGFSFYDDGDYMNARAIRKDIYPGTFGTILFGTRLYDALSADAELRLSILPIVIAHEFGHILQMKYEINDAFDHWIIKASREQHADYLSGWATYYLYVRRPFLNMSLVREFLAANAGDSGGRYGDRFNRLYGQAFYRVESFFDGFSFARYMYSRPANYAFGDNPSIRELVYIALRRVQSPNPLHPDLKDQYRKRKNFFDSLVERLDIDRH